MLDSRKVTIVSLIAVLAIALSVIVLAAEDSAKPLDENVPPFSLTVKSTLVGPVGHGKDQEDTWPIAVSPDGKHIASIVLLENDKRCVNLDGRNLKEYDWILPPVTFSPDSKRLAYVAATGRDKFVVLDGKETKFEVRVTGMLFSPDSQRFAFIEAYGDGTGWIVLDGVKSARYPHDVFWPVFSPDSKHFAYFVIREDHSMVIAIDGKEKEAKYPYNAHQQAVFTPDAQTLMYLTGALDKEILVVGDEEKPEYAAIPVSSPDGKRTANLHRTERGYTLVVDDGKGATVESKEYLRIRCVVFSPDSQHYAFLAVSEGNPRQHECMVLDGVEQKEYYEIAGVYFSPDSKHLAYVAKLPTGKQCVVLDGEEGPAYKRIAFRDWIKGSPEWYYDPNLNLPHIVFSPDSAHVAYFALKGEIEIWKDDESLKSRRMEEGPFVIVVDGVEADPKMVPCAYIIWDSPTTLHTIMRNKTNSHLVEITLTPVQPDQESGE